MRHPELRFSPATVAANGTALSTGAVAGILALAAGAIIGAPWRAIALQGACVAILVAATVALVQAPLVQPRDQDNQ